MAKKARCYICNSKKESTKMAIVKVVEEIEYVCRPCHLKDPKVHEVIQGF